MGTTQLEVMRFDTGQIVRLKCDVPDLDLHPGELGFVCSRWFEPLDFYEVEFRTPVNHCKVHVVLHEKQFCPVEAQSKSTLELLVSETG